MKAAIYPGEGRPIVIETLPDPEPAPGEVLIRIDRCGICGTDLAMTKGGAWDFGANARFGHEYAGKIVGLGRDVETLRVGQAVSVLPSGACGHCAGCAGGNHVLCHVSENAAAGFAEFASVPADLVVPLPAALSLADGALVEPLAVALYGVRQSGLTAGDTVLVLGGGTVALYAIYWARRLGARRIVALSRSERRRELCLLMGADAFVCSGPDEVGEVAEALGGAPDLVFECVGSEGMLGKATQHVKQYGKVVSLGFCTQPDPVLPAFAAYKCVTMQFLVGYGMRDFRYIVEQMDKGHCDPKAIVTNEVSLADLPATIERLRLPNDETKVHVRM